MSGRAANQQTRIILLLMAAVLLLPVYGSWVDIHYAERQPAHKHIYLGRVNLNHHHAPDSHDVVILPDQDATGRPVVLACLPGDQVVTKPAEPHKLSCHLADDYISPDDAFLPPPDHPPRI